MPLQRVPSGITGLDDLLYGGFLAGDAILVAGAPGTGKSTLGMQFLYQGIMEYEEPGFFITFEEFPQQIYRDALNFGWDFRGLEDDNKLKVLFTSPDLMFQDIMRHEGIFPEMIREIGAKRVVVDSITHFQHLANNTGESREIIYSIINALKREGLTPMLLRELVEGEVVGTVTEEYTSDSVVHLTMDRVNGQRMRYIEVLKSRGSKHIPAKSFFHIADNGLEVVPPFQDAFFHYQEAISVGIPELDSMLGGGIPYGSFYLFELSPEFHQEIIELNIIRETYLAKDQYLELTATGSRLPKLLNSAKSYGWLDEIQHAIDEEKITIINLLGDHVNVNYSMPMTDNDDSINDEAIFQSLDILDEAFQKIVHNCHGRLFLDVTRLLTTIDDDLFFALLTPLLDMIQLYDGVCIGFLNPDAVPTSAREKLLNEADGIIRLWSQQQYKYIQVNKTVNSVITTINAVQETNQAPYLRILPC